MHPIIVKLRIPRALRAWHWHIKGIMGGIAPRLLIKTVLTARSWYSEKRLNRQQIMKICRCDKVYL